MPKKKCLLMRNDYMFYLFYSHSCFMYNLTCRLQRNKLLLLLPTKLERYCCGFVEKKIRQNVYSSGHAVVRGSNKATFLYRSLLHECAKNRICLKYTKSIERHSSEILFPAGSIRKHVYIYFFIINFPVFQRLASPRLVPPLYFLGIISIKIFNSTWLAG